MSYNCTNIQMGLQSTLDSLVAATHEWDGQAELAFDDEIVEEEYAASTPGGAVEDTHIRGTGTTLTLKDTPASFQTLAYLLNMAVKGIAGPATSFPFVYPIPGTLAAAISMFTWEVALAGQVTQEYEFGNAFVPTWALKGDADANGGQMFMSAVVKGSKAIPSTLTSSLAFITAREMMNIRAASWDLNALGTAFETPGASPNYLASPITGTLRAFSLEQTRGRLAGNYVEGRLNKDFGTIEGGNDYILGGRVTGLLNATMVTEIANARAATGKVMQIVIPGASTVLCDIHLPIIWTSTPKILSEVKDGMILCSFDYKAKYSRTTTAQGPSINLTLATTTIT